MAGDNMNLAKLIMIDCNENDPTKLSALDECCCGGCEFTNISDCLCFCRCSHISKYVEEKRRLDEFKQSLLYYINKIGENDSKHDISFDNYFNDRKTILNAIFDIVELKTNQQNKLSYLSLIWMKIKQMRDCNKSHDTPILKYSDDEYNVSDIYQTIFKPYQDQFGKFKKCKYLDRYVKLNRNEIIKELFYKIKTDDLGNIQYNMEPFKQLFLHCFGFSIDEIKPIDNNSALFKFTISENTEIKYNDDDVYCINGTNFEKPTLEMKGETITYKLANTPITMIRYINVPIEKINLLKTMLISFTGYESSYNKYINKDMLLISSLSNIRCNMLQWKTHFPMQFLPKTHDMLEHKISKSRVKARSCWIISITSIFIILVVAGIISIILSIKG